jgi:hypothetical protein
MALVNTVMNLHVPQNSGKFLSSCTTGGFSRRAQIHEVSLVSYVRIFIPTTLPVVLYGCQILSLNWRLK